MKLILKIPGTVLSGLIIIILLLVPSILHSQTEDGKVHLPDSFSEPYVKISKIEVTGNKKTKEKIIIRELDFKPGDSLFSKLDKDEYAFGSGQKRISRSDSSELSLRMRYSRENIINTKLFLEADLYLEQIEGGEYKLRIDVKERWYFWAFPILQLDYPNFNDWLSDPDLSLLTMGLFMSHNNLWGLGHQASMKAFGGSSQGVALGYLVPWVGKGQKIGLLLGGRWRKSTVVEYGSLQNERQMIFDKGSMENYDFITTLKFRPTLYNYSKVRLTASNVRISDSLYNFTLDESIASFLPGELQNITYMTLYLEYLYDSRNSHAYPLKGLYLKGFIEKQGLGIIGHEVDYFNYGVDMHFYQEINSRWYVAEMFKFLTSSSANIPYYFKQNLTSGDDFIRGYDYYALRGDNMVYFRSNLKYNVIKPNVKEPRKEKNKDSKFRSIPYAFYINLIADAAYMRDEFYGQYNPYNNKFLYSWGLGVDFITYYDLVLRFEYVFTNIRTNGFYFGFGMPI
jgi:outer membrane protein assembly factor BamA